MPVLRNLKKLKLILWWLVFLMGCVFMVKETLAQSVFPLPGWFKSNIGRPAYTDRSKAISDYLASLTKDGKLNLTQLDAVRLVLENNLDVVVDRYDPTLAEYNIESAYRIFDPKLTATLGLQESKSPQPSAFVTGSNFLNSLGHQWNFNYSQLFQTGTQFSVEFDNNRYSNNSDRQNVNPYFQSGLTVSLVQPLLKNFGLLANNREQALARV